MYLAHIKNLYTWFLPKLTGKAHILARHGVHQPLEHRRLLGPPRRFLQQLHEALQVLTPLLRLAGRGQLPGVLQSRST